MLVKSNITVSGTAGDAYGADYTSLTYRTRYLMITIKTYAATIKLSWDAVNYEGDEFSLDPGTYFFEYECAGFKIKNTTAGQDAVYQVVGFNSAAFTA